MRINVFILLGFFFMNSIEVAHAQRLSEKELLSFEGECKQLARTFCGYIEDLTEENNNSKDMTFYEFYHSELCQDVIFLLKSFFSNEALNRGKTIGYTTGGKKEGVPVEVRYVSVDKYINMILSQRKNYKTVRYDFSAFKVVDLKEKIDRDGNIYYEGRVKFKQNYYTSLNSVGNSEKGWDVFHEDFKQLTFKIESLKTEEGKYYAITFHKLEIDLEEYRS